MYMQVLSESVSKALRLTGGEEVYETARFVSMVDRFFDSLNVNTFTYGKFKRKAFQDPYRSEQDFRLKVKVYVWMYMYMYVYIYNTVEH